MGWIITASGASVVYTTVFDREFAYPYHIVRYPEFGSVVTSQQLGGVIMGRLVHCQETCSHMKDFKESVGSVFRNAMWRGYPRRLVQSVWSRFLFQRWHSVDIRVKELRVWFAKIWSFLARNGAQKVPNPLKPSLPLSAMEGSIAVLGVVTSSSNSGMDCDPLDSAVLVSMANLAVSSYLISSSCTSVVPLQQQQQQHFVSSHFPPTTLSEPFYGDCYGRNIVTSNHNCGSSSGYGSSSSSSSDHFGSSGCVVATFSSSPSRCVLGHQRVSFNGVSTEIYPVIEPTHGVVTQSKFSSAEECNASVAFSTEPVSTVTVTVTVERTVERTVVVPVEKTVERLVQQVVSVEHIVPVTVVNTVERIVEVPVETTVERLVQQLVSVEHTVPISVSVSSDS